ncbi:MAG: CoA transferase, partial [Acidimicrobiia bacterium]|nr:CoA transferase [Acidimicrobiia bacterium]
HGAYPVSGDDRWVAIACDTDQHWQILAEVIGRSDLAGLGLAERFERHDELDAVIGAWTVSSTGHHVEQVLQERGVPAHRVLYAADVVADPQLAHRRAFSQVAHDRWGKVWIEDSAIHLSRTPGVARWAAPTFGEHLFPILTDILGNDEDAAADLIAAGIFV